MSPPVTDPTELNHPVTSSSFKQCRPRSCLRWSHYVKPHIRTERLTDVESIFTNTQLSCKATDLHVIPVAFLHSFHVDLKCRISCEGKVITGTISYLSTKRQKQNVRRGLHILLKTVLDQSLFYY